MMVWMRRVHYSRGFGVQSPSDYAFVRYVVNEHYPYYAYSDLQKEYQKFPKLSHKMGRLYFRLANYFQAERWTPLSDIPLLYAAYIRRGCRKTRIEPWRQQEAGGRMVCYWMMGDDLQPLEDVCRQARENSVLIVEGIRRNRTTKELWRRIVDDDHTGVTFDLHYLGIVFFDKRRIKQHYKINF
ncbi:hypothetical protein [Prevotella dentasini]